MSSMVKSSSAGRSLSASMLPALEMPASNTFWHCHCSPSNCVRHLAVVLLLPELDELLVLRVVDREGVSCRRDHTETGVAHGAHGRPARAARSASPSLGELVLRRLGQERVVVVAGKHEIDAVGTRLADLGDVGRVVLRAGGCEHLADEVPAEPLDLGLEHLDAVVAPRIVEPQRIEALELRVLDIERHRARAHRARGVGAEEIGHEAFRGQPAVAVVGRDEDRIPLGQLWHDRERLRRQGDAGEQPAIVALDHLLRLAHAGGRVADRVLDQELDLRPSMPPLAFCSLA